MVDLSKLAISPLDETGARLRWNTRPLVETARPDPYPADMLPPLIRDAVREVENYIQAPLAMIVASALSAVSAAVQTCFSVQRDAVLSGPASLFILTVAESGERKSSTDKVFAAPLIEWQAKERQEYKRRIAQYKLDLQSWESSRPEEDGDLLGYELSRPEEPRERRVKRGDDTPEALARHLANYPVAVLNSAEAGAIFGSHGMNPESVMRNLALFNEMWDGGVIDRDRVGTGALHVEGMRVTVGLQVQPQVLAAFVQKTGGLARGIGYFARFLFSTPESTQGMRYYRDPPRDRPALTAFCDRMTTLLDREPMFDEFDRLSPVYLNFDPKAQDTWIGFHNEVEEQLNGDEQYAAIRDVASKAADNAARLACCLHVFAGDEQQPIGLSSVIAACTLMRWYLAEAIRFAQVHGMSEAVGHAQALEEWLVREVNRRQREKGDILVPVNDARQKGPNGLRTREKMDGAIELLKDHGRLHIFKRTGAKGFDLLIAPAVLKEYS